MRAYLKSGHVHNRYDSVGESDQAGGSVCGQLYAPVIEPAVRSRLNAGRSGKLTDQVWHSSLQMHPNSQQLLIFL